MRGIGDELPIIACHRRCYGLAREGAACLGTANAATASGDGSNDRRRVRNSLMQIQIRPTNWILPAIPNARFRPASASPLAPDAAIADTCQPRLKPCITPDICPAAIMAAGVIPTWRKDRPTFNAPFMGHKRHAIRRSVISHDAAPSNAGYSRIRSRPIGVICSFHRRCYLTRNDRAEIV